MQIFIKTITQVINDITFSNNCPPAEGFVLLVTAQG